MSKTISTPINFVTGEMEMKNIQMLEIVNWNTYKFRCSMLPTLMTSSRTKGELGETVKTYLREIWIMEVFGRQKYDTKNKYTDKGISCESDSLDLVKNVLNQTYFKNNKELSNEWIKGTPDVILKDRIIDIKTPWDLWTFNAVNDEKAFKDYYYQLLGYMWLTESEKSDLLYCLVNTPEEIIAKELYTLSFRYPEINESDEAEAKYRANYVFDDIPEELKIKKYEYALEPTMLELLKDRILQCRDYLKGLTL